MFLFFYISFVVKSETPVFDVVTLYSVTDQGPCSLYKGTTAHMCLGWITQCVQSHCHSPCIALEHADF